MQSATSYFTDHDAAAHDETAFETDAHGTPPRRASVVGLGGQYAGGGMVQGERLTGASQVGAYTLRDAAMVADADEVLEDRPVAEHGDDISAELAHLLHGRRYATDGDHLDPDDFIDDMEFDLPTRAVSTDAPINRWTTA